MNCKHKNLAFVEVANKNGVFVKIYLCKNCKELIPLLPTKEEIECFNEG